MATNTTTENILIEHNTIRHSNYSVLENEYEVDIAVIAHKENDCNVSIISNSVEANHIISTNSLGYTHLQIDEASVDYFNNRINNSRLLHKYNAAGIKLNTIGMKLIESFGAGGDINLHMNKIIGNYLLAQFSLSPSSSEQIDEVNLTATNNYFEGRNFIFCRKLNKLNANFEGNEFISNSSYLLFQEYASTGTFSLVNNIWRKTYDSSFSNGEIYVHDETSGTNTSFGLIKFIGNIFVGFPSVPTDSLPDSIVKLVHSNICKQ